MRAMLPDGHGTVTLGEAPAPTPASGEIVIEVEAYSVNRGETFVLENPPAGWRPGKDVAGTVIDSAAGRRDLIGRRVVAHPEHSGWAERVAVPVTKVAVLPDEVAVETAAALPLAGLTALRLARAVGERLPGGRILLTGAAGGVGHCLTELAANVGADVTALCSTSERGARLLELGASRIITDLATDDEAPYDVVIESTGGANFAAAWRRLTARGLFLWMGQASRERPVIDFFDWTGGRDATLRKFLYSDSGTLDGDDLRALVRLVATGRLHPEIGRIAPWATTPEVLTDLVHRRIRGNAIMKVTP